MKKLYEKSELWFAIVFILLYCALQTVANTYSKTLGVEYALNAAFNIALSVILFFWIKKNGLLAQYGLCKTSVPGRKFLWYLPLVIIASHNLWNGAAINFPLSDMICYLLYMLCVGFVEEILFRGLLFKAIAKDNIKTAVVISSVTFGLGHILNLVNGAGMGLVENICQVIGAIAVGFLFVLIFYRGGSLLPCIITHSAIDMVSAFANESGLTPERRIALCAVKFVVVLAYTLFLLRTLPKKEAAEEKTDVPSVSSPK